MRAVDIAERRARLARRHGLAEGHRCPDVVTAATSMVCLHGTDPATVYLSALARVEGMSVADMEDALYVDRTLVKHMAMRRTLFVFPRAMLPLAQAGASDLVAERERRRLIRDVEVAGLHDDGERWLSGASEAVMDELADGRERSSSALREAVPLLEGSIVYGEGRSWGGRVAIGPRVLTTLSAAGRIVRASNDGGWAISRPRWATTRSWLGAEIDRGDHREGVAGLVSAWLRAFGPGTVEDLKWWLGSTLSSVRTALADIEAVEVDIDSRAGFLLPDDLEPVGAVDPWGALLPPLDPTTMGWFEREWYLGAYRSALFDANGNAGPTAWWDGRIVGGWTQRANGDVVLQLLEDVGSRCTRVLEDEAERLSAWLGGKRILPRFPTPLSKTFEAD